MIGILFFYEKNKLLSSAVVPSVRVEGNSYMEFIINVKKEMEILSAKDGKVYKFDLVGTPYLIQGKTSQAGEVLFWEPETPY